MRSVAYYKKLLIDQKTPIKQLSVSSVGGYINAITAINEFFGSNILFRGLSDKNYKVLSSAYRELENEGYNPPALQQLKKYHSQLTKGVLDLNDEEVGKHKESNVDLLAHLQHMGAKTCLIDYTKSSLVALWFACKYQGAKKHTDGAVLAIKSSLNLNLIDGKLNVGELFEKETEDVYIFDPPYINRRIIIQHSIFLFSPMGKINESKHIVKIVIKNRYKKSIISQLGQVDDIHKKTLFPDFIGFIEWFKYEDSNNERYNELIEEGSKNNYGGNYRAAIDFFEQALKLKVANDIEGATIYNKLGLAYNKNGEYAKALEYFEKALKIRERVLGKDHPDTATIYNNIGTIYAKKGEYAKALMYYKKALEIQELILGKDHSDTATTYNNIGTIYAKKGEYVKALMYYEKALEIFMEKFGENHQFTIEVKANIQIVKEKLNKK
jgi:Tfp pilus assembly protein PilF